MSFDTIFSDWLVESFENIVASKEWNVFISDLHDAVDHQLSENNIENFNNLLNHEKAIIINKALQSLSGNLCYQIIHERISQTLDLKINSEAERIIRVDMNPFQTRTEAILASAFEGVIAILNRWPDFKNKLSKMFNQSLPKYLRHHVWKAVLENEEVLKVYQMTMRSKPKKAISKYDKEISHYCESLLNTEECLSEMKGNVGCFYAMKAILSYYQASMMGETNLHKNECFLVIPIVYVLHDKLLTGEPPTLKIMEILVQEYFTLRQVINVDMLFINVTNKLSQNQYRYFCQQVYRHINTIDTDSAQCLMDHIIPAQGNIVATETKLFELAGQILEKLLRPVIAVLFVGFLSMETVLFVWDQYFLGFDKPNFREKYWAIICAIFLELIVRRKVINGNQSVKVALTENVFKTEGVKLKPFDFQYQINKSFYVELMKIINSENHVAVDPISGTSKWKHWFDSIHYNSPISPQDRNEMRVLRQQERQKFLDLQAQLESADDQRLKTEKKLEIQTEAYLKNYDKIIIKYESDNDKLKREIQDLQRENGENHKTIHDLKEELENLRQLNLRYATQVNFRGLVPPPATPNDSIVPRVSSPSNYENYSSDPLADFSRDYLSQLANSFTNILNGEGKEKFDLNDETIKFLNLFEEDRREAEMKLFGRYLNPGELRMLDADNDGYYSQKIYQEVSRKIDDRKKKVRPQITPNQIF